MNIFLRKKSASLFVALLTCILGYTQIVKSKLIDNGGSGPYKSIAVTEESLSNYVVYRPENIKKAVKKEGKLPIFVFANGGCNDTSITHEKVLTDIASHGYIVVALGALQADLKDRELNKTDGSMMLAAMDWLAEQNALKKSDYHNTIDLNKIATGGQSCGGCHVLATAKDPRVKTAIMYNSGIGEMTMADASPETLKNVSQPILYIIGGESDVAYSNAVKDYANLNNVPVAFANLLEGGHMGTFAEQYGGSFSDMALDWLDWQLKDKSDNASLFVDSDLSDYPGWTLESKNFN
ncbi:hypothetical protein [Flagellimonas sp. GZD32]|uniref:poly(ethylene terephthalate) hydrolase family protein n=1 Tax=Flagellimonas cixiensis TaxID=3228750 RepID=UPI0035C88B9D